MLDKEHGLLIPPGKLKSYADEWFPSIPLMYNEHLSEYENPEKYSILEVGPNTRLLHYREGMVLPSAIKMHFPILGVRGVDCLMRVAVKSSDIISLVEGLFGVYAQYDEQKKNGLPGLTAGKAVSREAIARFFGERIADAVLSSSKREIEMSAGPQKNGSVSMTLARTDHERDYINLFLSLQMAVPLSNTLYDLNS
jgi:hypothetical protein